jgi:hypothetical protein
MHENKISFFKNKEFLGFFGKIRYFNTGSVSYSVSLRPNIRQNC